MCSDCIETFHEIRMTNKIGRVLPPHCSAMGKVITAFQDRALADRILEVYGLNPRTERTIIDRQKLFAEFEEARRTGIAADREESIRGGICFGAALRIEGKPVVAADQHLHANHAHDRRTGEEDPGAILERRPHHSAARRGQPAACAQVGSSRVHSAFNQLFTVN